MVFFAKRRLRPPSYELFDRASLLPFDGRERRTVHSVCRRLLSKPQHEAIRTSRYINLRRRMSRCAAVGRNGPDTLQLALGVVPVGRLPRMARCVRGVSATPAIFGFVGAVSDGLTPLSEGDR